MPIGGLHYSHLDRPLCIGPGWYAGAVDMFAFLHEILGEFDQTISSVEQWQKDWVPNILDRLGAMEQSVHKQVFGHL